MECKLQHQTEELVIHVRKSNGRNKLADARKMSKGKSNGWIRIWWPMV